MRAAEFLATAAVDPRPLASAKLPPERGAGAFGTAGRRGVPGVLPETT